MLNIRNFCLPGLATFTLWLPAAAANIVLLLIALVVVTNKVSRSNLVNALKHPLIWTVLALWLLLGLTSLYSVAPFPESIDRWLKYKEFLWLPLFVALCHQQSDQKQALVGFLAGATLVLALSYGNFFELTAVLPEALENRVILRTDDGPVVFKLAITYSFMMALAACAFFILGNMQLKLKVLYYSLAILALFNVVAMVSGRTGYLVILAALVYFFYARSGYKGILIGIIIAIPLSLLTYSVTPKLKYAVNEGISEVQKWAQEPINPHPATSMEMRLNWWLVSIEAIQQRPLLGYGIGGYSAAYAELRDPAKYTQNDNPHNQILLFAVEAGLIWVALFILWWLALWQYAIRSIQRRSSINSHYVQLFQITWLAFSLACLVNSFFLDHTEGILIQAFTGMFLFGAAKQKQSQASNRPIQFS